MTKVCNKCNRKLDSKKFRISCDGYQRNTCRDCEKRRQRKVYHARKKKSEHFEPALKMSTTSRTDMFEKYQQMLDFSCDSDMSDKAYINLVLASRGSKRAVNYFVQEMTIESYKETQSVNFEVLCERYQRDMMKLRSLGADIDIEDLIDNHRLHEKLKARLRSA